MEVITVPEPVAVLAAVREISTIVGRSAEDSRIVIASDFGGSTSDVATMLVTGRPEGIKVDVLGYQSDRINTGLEIERSIQLCARSEPAPLSEMDARAIKQRVPYFVDAIDAVRENEDHEFEDEDVYPPSFGGDQDVLTPFAEIINRCGDLALSLVYHVCGGQCKENEGEGGARKVWPVDGNTSLPKALQALLNNKCSKKPCIILTGGMTLMDSVSQVIHRVLGSEVSVQAASTTACEDVAIGACAYAAQRQTVEFDIAGTTAVGLEVQGKGNKRMFQAILKKDRPMVCAGVRTFQPANKDSIETECTVLIGTSNDTKDLAVCHPNFGRKCML